MTQNPFIPFTIISSKLFKLEHELFQDNASFFKKVLLAIGIPRIDIYAYSKEIKDLYEKFQTILSKTTKEEREGMSKFTEKDEFINKMDGCILALMEIIESLEKKLKDNKSLKANAYKELVNDYTRKKLDLLEVTERIVTTKKKKEQEIWNNLQNTLNNWEEKSKKTQDLDEKEKNLSRDFENEVKDITDNPLHSTFVHKTLRNFALYKTMEFLKTCGLIASGELENVFYNTWLEEGGDKSLIQKDTFKPILLDKGKNMKIFAIKMPATKRVTEASWIALRPGLYKMFYTLEQTKDRGFALCGWTIGEDGQPVHYYLKDGIKDNITDFVKAITESSK
jgi:hypothetical protein